MLQEPSTLLLDKYACEIICFSLLIGISKAHPTVEGSCDVHRKPSRVDVTTKHGIHLHSQNRLT